VGLNNARHCQASWALYRHFKSHRRARGPENLLLVAGATALRLLMLRWRTTARNAELSPPARWRAWQACVWLWRAGGRGGGGRRAVCAATRLSFIFSVRAQREPYILSESFIFRVRAQHSHPVVRHLSISGCKIPGTSSAFVSIPRYTVRHHRTNQGLNAAPSH